MANMAMAAIYQQYLSAYHPYKGNAKLDAHNKSELKDIYKHIVRLNKEAPLYILDKHQEAKGMAIHIKESARQLQHSIYNTAGKAQDDVFKSRIAFSSNEDVITASYVGMQTAETAEDTVPLYQIEVHSLASSQVNMGHFLPAEQSGLAPGEYSFNIQIGDLAYEFQYNVTKEDTNLDIQQKLSRLINHAGIGLESTIVDTLDNTTSLRITSTKTGLFDNTKELQFAITDHNTSRTSGSVEYFGLDYVASRPSNAELTVNGKHVSVSSNHFTIEKKFEVELHSISPEDHASVYIGIKPNSESLKENMYTFIDGYNSFLDSIGVVRGDYTGANKLAREFNNIARLYYNELEAIGITTDTDGKLTVEEQIFDQAASSEDATDLFLSVKDFTSSLLRKSEQVAMDPLNYANRTIVAYKKPGNNFPAPYFISSYSGMLFNYYC